MSATHTLPIDAVLPAWRVKLFGACAMWHGLVQTCCCSAELFAWLDNIVGFFQTHHQTHAICVGRVGDVLLGMFGISVPRLGNCYSTHVLPCDPQAEHHHAEVPRKIIRVSVGRTNPCKFDSSLCS
jgi:hypothetical protein